MAVFETSTLNIRGVRKTRDMDTYASAQNIPSARGSGATVNLFCLSHGGFFFSKLVRKSQSRGRRASCGSFGVSWQGVRMGVYVFPAFPLLPASSSGLCTLGFVHLNSADCTYLLATLRVASARYVKGDVSKLKLCSLLRCILRGTYLCDPPWSVVSFRSHFSLIALTGRETPRSGSEFVLLQPTCECKTTPLPCWNPPHSDTEHTPGLGELGASCVPAIHSPPPPPPRRAPRRQPHEGVG